MRIDADPKEHNRLHRPAVALTGDAKPILQSLLAELPAHNSKRATRKAEMQERQAVWRKRFEKIAPQIAYLEAIRDELPEDGIFVEDITQMVFAARVAYPVYKPRTYISPGFQDPLGLGFATALGAQHARSDVPVVAICGDGGFMFTATEMATAMRHRIPLVTVVFNDGAYGNVRRIQKERFGNHLIASDLLNPDFVAFGKSFGAEAVRARSPEELRTALRRAFRLPRRADPDRSARGRIPQPVGVHQFDRASFDHAENAQRLIGSPAISGLATGARPEHTPPMTVALDSHEHAADAPDHHDSGTRRRVPADGCLSVRHHRHGVPARDHLLSAVVRARRWRPPTKRLSLTHWRPASISRRSTR